MTSLPPDLDPGTDDHDAGERQQRAGYGVVAVLLLMLLVVAILLIVL